MRLYNETDLSSMKDQEFFQHLGRRVADLRQAQGMTQAALADALGLRQQVIATYENATRRFPASLLVPTAEHLGVTVEELLDLEHAPSRRGPPSQIQQRFEDVAKLPRSRQKKILDVVDALIKA